ncbi:MAG: hypothetical protein NVV73_19080 [Cellvibrionaceae bacterium]|nr:hypothetical protein [Cellvibrionaceae bacterium]
MAVLVLGFLVLIFGLGMMRNSELDRVLKENDEAEWTTVMRPSSSGYVNSFGTIPLFTWVLGRGYEKSASEQVRTIGSVALKKAQLAKNCMLIGVALIAIGFALALFL